MFIKATHTRTQGRGRRSVNNFKFRIKNFLKVQRAIFLLDIFIWKSANHLYSMAPCMMRENLLISHEAMATAVHTHIVRSHLTWNPLTSVYRLDGNFCGFSDWKFDIRAKFLLKNSEVLTPWPSLPLATHMMRFFFTRKAHTKFITFTVEIKSSENVISTRFPWVSEYLWGIRAWRQRRCACNELHFAIV